MSIPITAATGTGITPQMPSEPPQEVKDLVFTPDVELISNGGDTTITDNKGNEIKETPTTAETASATKEVTPVKEVVKAKEEPKKEEVSKSVLKPPTEEKKVESVVEKKTDKLPIKQVTPVKEKKEEVDQFDYSKYGAEQQQVLKQMSNAAKKEYAKVVDENKQLASQKDANFFQHEQGYTLSPEYSQLQQKNYYAQTEGQCWEQALLDIKAGKMFRDITGFNEKGEPIMGEERQATDRDEIRITNNLSACMNVSQQLGNVLQQFPQQFKQRITQDMQAVESVRKEKFSWVADPKLLDYSINVEGIGDKKLKDIKSDFKSMFPSYIANSPGVEVASDLMISLLIQGAELKEARNGQQIAQIKQKEATRGEPTSDTHDSAPTSLSAKGIPSVFNLDGMPTY